MKALKRLANKLGLGICNFVHKFLWTFFFDFTECACASRLSVKLISGSKQDFPTVFSKPAREKNFSRALTKFSNGESRSNSPLDRKV